MRKNETLFLLEIGIRNALWHFMEFLVYRIRCVSVNDFAYAKVFQSKRIKMLLNVINQIMIYYSKMISDFCKGIDDESGIDKRKMWRWRTFSADLNAIELDFCYGCLCIYFFENWIVCRTRLEYLPKNLSL